jgi:hypothetical protein
MAGVPLLVVSKRMSGRVADPGFAGVVLPIPLDQDIVGQDHAVSPLHASPSSGHAIGLFAALRQLT